MKQFYLSLIIIFSLTLTQIYSNGGFAANTPIKTLKNSWISLKQICEHIIEEEDAILSYDFHPVHSPYTFNKIVKAGKSTTNCYVNISLDNNSWDKISCTPNQEFYLAKKKRWVAAHLLKSGDFLLSEGFKLKEITHIELIKKPLDVYSIEVEDTHNFFVSRHSILTHNMAWPLFQFGISAAFGSGAVAGGSTGSFFGPIGTTTGIVIGGIGAIVVHSFINNKVREYKSNFDPESFKNHHNTDNDDDIKQKNNPSFTSNNSLNHSPEPDPDKKKSNQDLAKQTKQQLEKGKRTLNKRINEHRVKLENYKKNPELYDNKNFLKKNAQNISQQQKIKATRIKGLTEEIKKFENNIEEINLELEKRI